MTEKIKITEKYERNGWPSIKRPDIKPPKGWDLSLLSAVKRIRNHALSPDGEQIAFIWDRDDLSDIYTMPARGGWPSRISTKRGLVAFWDDELPRWSPDSQWLAFTIGGHIHIAPAQNGLPEKISDFAESASAPVWMPDSRGLIVSIERHEANQLLLTDHVGSWPRPLTNHTEGDAWDARPAPDHRTVAHVFSPFNDLNRSDIRLINLETGSSFTLIGQPQELNHTPRWSPNSDWLAFLSQRSGFFEIWLIKPDGEGLRQLTKLGFDCHDPTWSPDGTHIAFTINRGGSYELALVTVDTGEISILRNSLGYHSLPYWTPDGTALIFAYENSILPPDLYRLDLTSRQIQQLTFSNLGALVNNALVTPERISYRSYDNLEIPALLYQPPKPNGAAVLHPHGGPSAQYLYDWDILAQYLVAKGYTFIAPNYRGSTGYGREYEWLNHNDWGVGDTQDCLYGARFLGSLPSVDPLRIAIFGGSYGGYMTACTLARDPEYLFACGISKYGDANITSSWAQCNRYLRRYTEIFMGHPAKNQAAFLAGSPIHQVANIQKPILILHGLLDDVVPPEASEEWVEALRRHDKVFEYKTYAREPHGFLLQATQMDVWDRVERFLDWHLMPLQEG